jgi:hypothetical protein
MTPEEFLASPEGQALLNSQTEAKLTKAVETATAGLVAKRDELLAEKKKASAELNEIKSKYNLEEYDKVLGEYKAIQESKLSAEEKLAKREQELAAQFSQREKELLKKIESETSTLTEQVTKKDQALRKYLVDSKLQSEIVNASGVPELLMPALRDKVKVLEENGEYVVRVIDNGVTRIGDSSGTPMSIQQLVNEFKENPIYGMAFKSSGATGGSATGNSTASTSGAAMKRSTMSVSEKTAFVDKHGKSAYLKLDY